MFKISFCKAFIISISSIFFIVNSEAQSIKNCSPPEYPKGSSIKPQGIVVVGLGIDSSGKLITLGILRSSGDERLDNSALNSIRTCTFNPKIINNVAVESRVQQIFKFFREVVSAEDEKNNFETVRQRQYEKTGFYPEDPNPEVEKLIDDNIKQYVENQIKEQKRQAWLLTPEGKKFQAEEEMLINKKQQELAKAEEKKRQQIAKEFPYIAIITCGMNGNHLAITGCFTETGKLEVTNGEDYGLYKIYQIASGMIPNSFENKEGLNINLRNKFSIIASNGGNLILGIKIIKRSDNKKLFQKEVDKYGVIKISD